MVIEKSARSRKYSPMSMHSLFPITFFLKHLSNTCVLRIICAFFESSQLTAILFLFRISNIFLIIFHIITNCNMSFLESRTFLVATFLDFSFSHSTSSLYAEQLWVEINLKSNVFFFKSVYIHLLFSCTCVRPLTSWECLLPTSIWQSTDWFFPLLLHVL